METLVMAIGIILIIEGAINLLSALYTVLAIRRFAKLHPETQSMLESLTGQDLNGDGVIAPDIAPADVEASAVELDHVDESAEAGRGLNSLRHRCAMPPPSMREALATPIKLPSEKRLPLRGSCRRQATEGVCNE